MGDEATRIRKRWWMVEGTIDCGRWEEMGSRVYVGLVLVKRRVTFLSQRGQMEERCWRHELKGL